jgi:hypothetical protein
MAIIIPSKNIYNKENLKVRDNVINGTEGEVTERKSTRKTFFSIEWQPFNVSTPSSTETTFTPVTLSSPNISDFKFSLLSQNISYASFDVTITSEQYLDILQNNITVYGQKTKAFATGKTATTQNFQTSNILKEETTNIFYSHVSNSPINVDDIYTYVVYPSSYNNPTKEVKLHFKINVASFIPDTYSWFTTRIKLDFVGGVLEYPKINASYGSTEKSISLSTNELFSPSFFNSISSKVINEYRNGKETATILASIGEYYNNNGTLAISTKKRIDGTDRMTFEIGNEVIPMICGADRNDYPMSRYRDGTPKIFRVCGTKIYYDGAVWQELTLQEK